MFYSFLCQSILFLTTAVFINSLLLTVVLLFTKSIYCWLHVKYLAFFFFFFFITLWCDPSNAPIGASWAEGSWRSLWRSCPLSLSWERGLRAAKHPPRLLLLLCSYFVVFVVCCRQGGYATGCGILFFCCHYDVLAVRRSFVVLLCHFSGGERGRERKGVVWLFFRVSYFMCADDAAGYETERNPVDALRAPYVGVVFLFCSLFVSRQHQGSALGICFCACSYAKERGW